VRFGGPPQAVYARNSTEIGTYTLLLSCVSRQTKLEPRNSKQNPSC
jgi:hypothetical protein